MGFEKNGSKHSNNKDRQNSVLSGFSMQYCESIDGSDSSPKEDLICRKYYQIFCAVTGSMGLLSSAIFVALSGCILPQLEDPDSDVRLNEYEGSLFASLGFVAGIVGSLLGGYECEILGRKTCLMIQNSLVFSSLVLMGLAPSFGYMIVGRTVHGYAYGAITGAVPVYVSEVCQPKIRSMVGGAAGTFYCFATASVFTLGALVPWRWLLLICAAFPLVNFIMLLFAVESPTWYLLKGRHEDAFQVLNKLRGNQKVAEMEYGSLLQNFKKRQEMMAQAKDVPKWRILFDLMLEPTFVRPLFSLIFIVVFGYHVSGLAPLLLYMNKIILQTGATSNPYWISASLQLSRAFLVFCSSLYLPLFPRRALISVCLVVMAVANLVIGLSVQFDFSLILGTDHVFIQWLPIIGIFLLYIGMASGQSHVIVCLQGELLPSFGRAIGSGVLGVFDAAVLFLVAKFLPDLDKAIGLGNCFLIFSGCCLTLVVFIWWFVPETRGLSLDQVEDYYRVLCYGNGYDDDKLSKRWDRLSVYDQISIWGEEITADQSAEIISLSSLTRRKSRI